VWGVEESIHRPVGFLKGYKAVGGIKGSGERESNMEKFSDEAMKSKKECVSPVVGNLRCYKTTPYECGDFWIAFGINWV
jgi:hypothetical protein